MKPGLLNYLNLHHDIVAISEQIAKQKQLTPTFERTVDYVPLQVNSLINAIVKLNCSSYVFFLNSLLKIVILSFYNHP